jgi:epoxide hydrolase-like predicted phosphatase
MPIKALIFDLFDVLFLAEDFTQRRAYEQRMGLAEHRLQKVMQQSPLFKEAIIGHISASELWQEVARTVGDDTQNWQQIANIFFSANRLNTELIALIRTLRPAYKTAILSNAPYDVRSLITERFQLAREVDTVIISAEEGMRKPQPEFFQIATQRLNILPQEAIFIDDDPRFVTGAQAIGMTGIQFKDNPQTITEIQRWIEFYR